MESFGVDRIPLSFVVEPNAQLDEVEIEAIARLDGALVVERTARSGFDPGHTRVLRIELDPACAPSCPTIVIEDPRTLPELTRPGDELTDAARSDAGRDAGRDFDAGPPFDAGPFDAGVVVIAWPDERAREEVVRAIEPREPAPAPSIVAPAPPPPEVEVEEIELALDVVPRRARVRVDGEPVRAPLRAREGSA